MLNCSVGIAVPLRSVETSFLVGLRRSSEFACSEAADFRKNEGMLNCGVGIIVLLLSGAALCLGGLRRSSGVKRALVVMVDSIKGDDGPRGDRNFVRVHMLRVRNFLEIFSTL